jgi:molybdate transport system substrate-binding protein
MSSRDNFRVLANYMGGTDIFPVWERVMRTLSKAFLIATALLILMGAEAANAVEVKVLCANGMRDVMEEVGPMFARATNNNLATEFGTIGVILQRIDAGEKADVVIIPPIGTNRLLASGKGLANTDVVIAHSGIGVAIRRDAPRPDISTPESFRQVLLNAKSITYLDPSAGGTTGPHFLKVIERLGIANEIKAKAVLHRSGREAAQLVAEGKAEIGINLAQELLPNSEVQVIGPLPGDLQLRLSFSAVILSESHERDASKALIAFLRNAGGNETN